MDQIPQLTWDSQSNVKTQYKTFEHAFALSGDASQETSVGSPFFDEIRAFIDDLRAISPRRVKACPVLDNGYAAWIDDTTDIVQFVVLNPEEEGQGSSTSWGFKFLDPIRAAAVDEDELKSFLGKAKRKRSGSRSPSTSSSSFLPGESLFFVYFEDGIQKPSGMPSAIAEGILNAARDVRLAAMTQVQSANLVDKSDIRMLIRTLDGMNSRMPMMLMFFDKDDTSKTRTEFRVMMESIGDGFMHADHDRRKMRMCWQSDPCEAQEQLCFLVNSDYAILNVFYNRKIATFANMRRQLFSHNGAWFKVYDKIVSHVLLRFGLIDAAGTAIILHARTLALHPWIFLTTYLTKRNHFPRITMLEDDMSESPGIDEGGLTRAFWSQVTCNIFGTDSAMPAYRNAQKRILLSDTQLPYLNPAYNYHTQESEGAAFQRMVESLKSMYFFVLMYNHAVQRELPVSRMVNDKFFHLVRLIYHHNRTSACIESLNPTLCMNFSSDNHEPPHLPMEALLSRRELFEKAVHLTEDDSSFCKKIANFFRDYITDRVSGEEAPSASKHMQQHADWSPPPNTYDTESDSAPSSPPRENESAKMQQKGLHVRFRVPSEEENKNDHMQFLEEKRVLLEGLQWADVDEIDEELEKDPHFQKATQLQKECWTIYRKGFKVFYKSTTKYIEFAYYFMKGVFLIGEHARTTMELFPWANFQTTSLHNLHGHADRSFELNRLLLIDVFTHDRYSEFSKKIQGNPLDRHRIAACINVQSTASVNAVVREKVEYLKEHILDPAKSSDTWLEDFLFCVTGLKALTDAAESHINIIGHGGPFCSARTCFRTLAIPNHHDTPPYPEPNERGKTDKVHLVDRFIKNLEITMFEKGFSMA